MKTVGEILRNIREEKKLSFLEISKEIKIRPNFLESLENNKFNCIGEATVVKGFIKNYAEFLGLSSKDTLAVFRRDFIEDKTGQILPRGTYDPLDRRGFSWTPRATVILVVIFIFILFLSYIVFQVYSLTGAPNLKIVFPVNNQETLEATINLRGKTDQDAIVYVNGNIISLSTEGNFDDEISLLPGDNIIKFEAISRRGKKTVKEVMVRYQVPD